MRGTLRGIVGVIEAALAELASRAISSRSASAPMATVEIVMPSAAMRAARVSKFFSPSVSPSESTMRCFTFACSLRMTRCASSRAG